MKALRLVPVAVVGTLLSVVTFGALASNTVPLTRLEASALVQGGNDYKPDACNGITVTNVVLGTAGTSGNDLMLGTSANETFNGQGGNDCIVGGGGNDSFRAGAGTDVCLGGPGNDTNTQNSCETFVQ